MKSESFKEKLNDWFDFFEPFILSKDMDEIYIKLKSDSIKKNINTGDKIKIFPTSDNTFKAFNLCKKNNLKLVIYGSDPYPGEYFDTKLPHADGLCLSNSNSHNGKAQPSLKYFLDGIALGYNINYDIKNNLDLSYLSEQGILLLNRSLTVKKGLIGSYLSLWDKFNQFFLEKLQSEYPGVPTLFLGEESYFLKRYVFEMSNPVIKLSHPSASARNQEDWYTYNSFNKINSILRSNFNVAIKWFKYQWDEIQEDLNSEDPEIVRLAKLKDEKEGLPF